MGMSVDAYLLDAEKLIDSVMSAAKVNQDRRDIMEKALPLFGQIKDIDGKQTMLILNCEYWQEYNSYYEIMTFIGRFYGLTDEAWSLVHGSKLMKMGLGANAEEVATKLNIELPSDDDDEEEE